MRSPVNIIYVSGGPYEAVKEVREALISNSLHEVKVWSKAIPIENKCYLHQTSRLPGLNIKLGMNFQYYQTDDIKGTQRDLKIIFILKMRLSREQLKCEV